MRLWRQWGPRVTCYHCGHGITPGLGTVQHLISPRVRSDLATAESNCNPCHAGGKRRCGTCGLSCQDVAASNTATRDAMGRPLPFTAEFIAMQQAERARKLARTTGSRRELPPSAGTREIPGIPPLCARPP
jgi:hypothetical protein